jgi:hypothetical protein
MKIRVDQARLGRLTGYFDPSTPGGDLARDLGEARDVIARLANALRHLHDDQNGCPLPKYEKSWNRAMAKSIALLHEIEPVVESLGMTIED